MKEHRPSIDLGSLQTSLQDARKRALSDEKALLRAQDARDASKARLEKAIEDLKLASRAVLS